MKTLRSILTLSLIILSLYACVPMNNYVVKEPGTLNLAYDFPQAQTKKTNLSIAIVSPQMAGDPKMNNMYVNMNQAQMAQPWLNPYFFNSRFFAYKDQVITGFDNGLQELITRKGFNVKGPYSTFDDLTFNDKKEAYLALIPSLNVNIEKKGIQKGGSFDVYTETGIIQVNGELRLDFIEPMTKEKVLVQRINLSSLNVEKPYKIQGTTGAIAAALVKSEDTSDQALADACNEFYRKAMGKIWEFVSEEELLGYKKQIQDLKGLKRF